MSLRVELSRIASRARRAAWLRRMLIGMSAWPVLWLAMALAETSLEWPVWVRLLAGWAAPLAVVAWAVMPLLRKADLGALAHRRWRMEDVLLHLAQGHSAFGDEEGWRQLGARAKAGSPATETGRHSSQPHR